MRSALLFCLTLSLSVVAQSQTISSITDPPDAVVVKHGWSKERINWEGDPFGGPVETFDDMRRRMADQRRIDRARGSGNIAEAAKVEREMRSEQVIKARPPAPARYGFLYRASVKNTGEKTIKLIDWDYVIFNTDTHVEIGRLQFTTEQKIAPGKSKELNAMSRKPPAPTVSIYALGKNERLGLDGQVELVRVEYTDNTVWQRP